MKHALTTTLALLALAAAAPSFADDATAVTGKTRAQVRAELIQAEAQGWVPVQEYDYPPSAATLARNREIYRLSHADTAVTTATAVSGPNDAGP